MKRRGDWREKLDPEGVSCLEGFRKTAEVRATVKDSSQWRAKLDAIRAQHPELRVLAKVDVVPEFLKLVLANEDLANLVSSFEQTPGTKVMPRPAARFVEVTQLVTLALEDPQMRVAAGFISGFAALILGNIYRDVSRGYFGDAGPQKPEDWMWTLGTVLEILGQGLKGKSPRLKGKINLELIELIKIIRTHQKERLTYRELRAALEYAGVHPPDEEALRLFEWRAHKKGWIKPAAPPAST
jgi:hypothetical protein